ncbi:MAG: GatB/YqeY domain-containing protein [Bdellovibrionaceae bacterium]|jgi:uncharacterized protein|nr:GatB/YqeY domain-containing protein [Pseudobdellovibrionaceae bacterium]
MSLKAQILTDIKNAMKAKEAEKLETLRFLNAAIKNKEIEVRPKEISDEDILTVIKKMAKQRKDSIEQFEKAQRQDLADKEKSQLKFIENYLPEQLSKEQIEQFVNEAVSELKASSMKDMGAVMKAVTVKAKGAADNKLVSEAVRAKLN